MQKRQIEIAELAGLSVKLTNGTIIEFVEPDEDEVENGGQDD